MGLTKSMALWPHTESSEGHSLFSTLGSAPSTTTPSGTRCVAMSERLNICLVVNIIHINNVFHVKDGVKSLAELQW